MFGTQVVCGTLGSLWLGHTVAAAGGEALGFFVGSLAFFLSVGGALVMKSIDEAEELDDEFDL